MGKGHKKKHLKKRRPEQVSVAARYVAHWARMRSSSIDASAVGSSNPSASQNWIPTDRSSASKAPIIDLHTHSNYSDGMLSPGELVKRAIINGVQVLALTDHDTMAGVPAAFEAANKFGARLIPGVEISALSVRGGVKQPVHILGYYSCCGPARWQELERNLARIREGRFHRAKAIVNKLKILKKPVSWENVSTLAGVGVAPGRMHIARAMVEAGHVESVREAFNKYLYDDGPAYALGYELVAEDAVRLVCDTGGFAALAHPWALKDPLSVVKRLKVAGLHAMEVYRGDGKVNGFAALAEAYQLVKLGGSDYHARGDPDETGLGKVQLPLLTIHEFLNKAEPIWCFAIKEILHNFAEETFQFNSDKVVGLKYFSCEPENFKGDISIGYRQEGAMQRFSLRFSAWLTEEERLIVEDAAAQLKLELESKGEDENVILTVWQPLRLHC